MNEIHIPPPLPHDSHKADRISHDTPLLKDGMEYIKQSRGRSMILSAGEYLVNETLEYLKTEDCRANASIVGRGMGATTIRQDDNNIPLFDLGTTSGNLRMLGISNMSLHGGSRAIRTSKTVYNQFCHLEISHGRGDYAIETTASNDQWLGVWFVHTPQACGRFESGGATFNHCRFGEDCGALDTRANLKLNGCIGHSLKAGTLPWSPNEEAWLYVSGGGSLSINGCDLSTNRQLNAFIWSKNARDISISNSRLGIHEAPVFYLNAGTVAWADNYGGTTYQHDGGKVISSNPTGLTYYSVDRPERDPTHRYSRVSPTIEHTSEFEWGDEFLAALGNSTDHSVYRK